VMQRHNRRDGEFGEFGNEEVAGHFHIRSSPEVQPLAHVVASVHALEDLRSRVCHFRPVGHELEDFSSCFSLPSFEILWPAMEKSKALVRLFLLLLNKWIQISKRRALPALAFVSRRSGLRYWKKGLRLCLGGSPRFDGQPAQALQELASSKCLPHLAAPLST